MTNRAHIPPHSTGPLRRRATLVAALGLMTVGSALAQDSVSVAARATAIKGTVIVSTPSGGEHKLEQGETIRAGTIINAKAGAGALFRPSANSSLVVYPSSKVRFDGASVGSGSEHISCTILEGKAWFGVGQNGTTPTDGTPNPNVKITVTTQQGSVTGQAGNWTVQYEEGRTMIAVGEGKSMVTVGSAAGGGGQVEVAKGSVIWLQTSAAGTVEAQLVNTETGTVTPVSSNGTLGTPTQASSELLASSKTALAAPSSAGGTSSPVSTPSITPPSTTTTPPNPDFSTRTPNVPVVSSETP